MNFLEMTLETMHRHRLDRDSVCWVQLAHTWTDWERFKEMANVEIHSYDEQQQIRDRTWREHQEDPWPHLDALKFKEPARGLTIVGTYWLMEWVQYEFDNDGQWRVTKLPSQRPEWQLYDIFE